MNHWFPYSPANDPKDPFFTNSDLILDNIELGVGFITFWGRGNVRNRAIGSNLAFRQWYLQVYQRLPDHVKKLQGVPISHSERAKPVEDLQLMHHTEHREPHSMDHFHILYPTKKISHEDMFMLRLLMNNLGWVMPILFKDYLVDNTPIEHRSELYDKMEARWMTLMKDRGINP